MPPHFSHLNSDVNNSARIPVVTLKDPRTGLPVQVLKPEYESALRRKQPITITIYPEDALPDTSDRMSEEDEIIAEIIDTNPGCDRADIYRLAEANYGLILGTDGLKNRMRRGQPLPSKGYHSKNRRYYPPEV